MLKTIRNTLKPSRSKIHPECVDTSNDGETKECHEFTNRELPAIMYGPSARYEARYEPSARHETRHEPSARYETPATNDTLEHSDEQWAFVENGPYLRKMPYVCKDPCIKLYEKSQESGAYDQYNKLLLASHTLHK